MKSLKTFITSAACLILFANFGFARGSHKAEKKEPVRVQEDRVTAISPDSISITHTSVDHAASSTKNVVYKDVVRVYRITSWTDVQIDGHHGTLAEIKVGMAATVSASGSVGADGNGGDATMIVAHSAAPVHKPGA